MSRHAGPAVWTRGAIATLTVLVALIVGGIAGLLVAINALNGSLGTPLWAARRELLLALIAADLVSMARIGLLLRRMRRRQ